MSAATTDPILESSSGNLDAQGWSDAIMSVMVSGVSGASWPLLAAAAIAAAGYSIGDEFPLDANCLLQKITPVALSTDVVKLTLNYARETSSVNFIADDVEVGASIIQTDTNIDKDGNEMFLSYEYPIGYKRSPHDEALAAAVPSGNIGHTASKMTPQGIWTVNKVETITREALKSKVKKYVGAVNSTSFDGDAARTHLCTRIHGKSQVSDPGKYNITYEFQFKDNTWDEVGVFIKDDGKPPYPTDSNSKKTWRILKEENFNNLDLV
jgi:hypothetical protein